jgi:hypothetical protein
MCARSSLRISSLLAKSTTVGSSYTEHTDKANLSSVLQWQQVKRTNATLRRNDMNKSTNRPAIKWKSNRNSSHFKLLVQFISSDASHHVHFDSYQQSPRDWEELPQLVYDPPSMPVLVQFLHPNHCHKSSYRTNRILIPITSSVLSFLLY